ncbi:hypothetical protein DVP88_00720 [Yersinia enterocolitica]|nr:hypothetical protein [Yersinia enterocolitica]
MLSEKARRALRGLDFRHKKRPQLRSLYILMVPKAGLEPNYPQPAVIARLFGWKSAIVGSLRKRR